MPDIVVILLRGVGVGGKGVLLSSGDKGGPVYTEGRVNAAKACSQDNAGLES